MFILRGICLSKQNKEFKIVPIGSVKRTGDGIYLEIFSEYRPALQQLEHFSHVHVFWWADKCDNEKKRKTLQCTPPYGEKPPVTGVFATRAEYRPNPISVTVAEILEINHEQGIVKVKNIDAFNETPIIDLKAYFPVCDRVQESTIPDWIIGWPEWFPDDGMGLWEGEEG
ncbi:MAG: tRNA (N6-threonylcarbamoyladenosine(37)-N6)-methyltransferase TrmO [Asgard group archaeon]|nr:tRNA (N6-threonylcarbamoyladenosine(37)-N6)-methyltransferase TrmO [Asgard group archaeon]